MINTTPPVVERPREPRPEHHLWRAWRRVWPVLRQVLGWTFIALGIVGIVLPLLQGVLFLMIGIALVGRRNWLIRWCAVHIKLALRRWASHPHPVVGAPGRWSLRAQRQLSRQRRRTALRWMERRSRSERAVSGERESGERKSGER